MPARWQSYGNNTLHKENIAQMLLWGYGNNTAHKVNIINFEMFHLNIIIGWKFLYQCISCFVLYFFHSFLHKISAAIQWTLKNKPKRIMGNNLRSRIHSKIMESTDLESPFPRLTVAGWRIVWFFTISTTHLVFNSFSVDQKTVLKPNIELNAH